MKLWITQRYHTGAAYVRLVDYPTNVLLLDTDADVDWDTGTNGDPDPGTIHGDGDPVGFGIPHRGSIEVANSGRPDIVAGEAAVRVNATRGTLRYRVEGD